MMDFAKSYFNAEKAESLVFFAIGIAAIAAAVWFFFFKNDALLLGAAWPLAIVALIQIAVGANIYVRSPKDLARVEQFLANDTGKIPSEEIPRMDQVMKQFVVLRWAEISLLLAGIVLAFVSKNDFWRGVGYGLAVQAGLMLVADYFAEARGHVYVAALKKLI
jgi:hypothetical protein